MEDWDDFLPLELLLLLPSLLSRATALSPLMMGESSGLGFGWPLARSDGMPATYCSQSAWEDQQNRMFLDGSRIWKTGTREGTLFVLL
jgi:hypothetical protein